MNKVLILFSLIASLTIQAQNFRHDLRLSGGAAIPIGDFFREQLEPLEAGLGQTVSMAYELGINKFRIGVEAAFNRTPVSTNSELAAAAHSYGIAYVSLTANHLWRKEDSKIVPGLGVSLGYVASVTPFVTTVINDFPYATLFSVETGWMPGLQGNLDYKIFTLGKKDKAGFLTLNASWQRLNIEHEIEATNIFEDLFGPKGKLLFNEKVYVQYVLLEIGLKVSL